MKKDNFIIDSHVQLTSLPENVLIIGVFLLGLY